MDYKARMYDAFSGRFIQPDTVVPEPGSSQGYNRYTYVNNNPVNFSDPSGHMATYCSPGDGCGGQYLVGPGGLAENDQKLAELAYDSTGEKQEKNKKTAETITKIGTFVSVTIMLGVGGGFSILPAAYEDLVWEAGVSCLQSSLCRFLTGAVGGATVNAASQIDDIWIPARKVNQMGERGWSLETIQETINYPELIRTNPDIVNRATGNQVTYYYRLDGYYVVLDNVTHQVVQFANTNDPFWIDEMTNNVISSFIGR